MMTTRLRRRGLTLVEMLVTLGIISLLLALLLPSVQRVRSDARQVQCRNNLKQLGLALHNYHDTHRGFPPGYSPMSIDSENLWTGAYATYAWGSHLLPYLEESALYGQLDLNLTSLEDLLADVNRARLAETQLGMFRCPNDLAEEDFSTAPINPKLQPLNRDPDQSPATPIYGASASYVGSCGYFAAYHPGSPEAGTNLASKDELTGPNNGLFYPASHVRIADITDGSSQTFAVGERAWFMGSAMWIGCANIQGAWSGGAGVSLGRVYWRLNEIPDPPGILVTPENGEWIRGAGTARDGFSSYHIGGANFLMADGSVRFVAENIEFRNTTPAKVDVSGSVRDVELLGVYQRLGIRNDGQVVSQF